jgi:hypothetical protein
VTLFENLTATRTTRPRRLRYFRRHRYLASYLCRKFSSFPDAPGPLLRSVPTLQRSAIGFASQKPWGSRGQSESRSSVPLIYRTNCGTKVTFKFSSLFHDARQAQPLPLARWLAQ